MAHLRLQLQSLLQVRRCPALAVERVHSWLVHTRQRKAHLQSQLQERIWRAQAMVQMHSRRVCTR